MQYFVHRNGTLVATDLDKIDMSQMMKERDLYEWKRIPRAQWRQLKREQKQANNVSKMMIQDAKDSGLNP